jgi:mono/diheme cytochrome c family protein
MANCEFCHGPNGAGGSAPNIQGESAADIQNAINTVPQMSGVNVTPAEIQAIADFLGQF